MVTPNLVELGTTIADGTPIDWTSSELHVEDPALGQLLTQLQVIERIAAVHAAPGEWPVAEFDSLLEPRTRHTGSSDRPVTWGPLIVLEKVGRGTFADVYRALDPKLDRHVALKLMRCPERGTDAFDSDVIEEGRLLACVDHPHVVTVYGAERIDGRVGIWMAFVEGRTLADEVKAEGPLPAGEVVSAGIALAGALEAVHGAGLLHRDIKAQNSMRDRSGRVLLTDFGAGRTIVPVDDAGRTGNDGPAGTPLYLAPEVLEGQPASVLTDVYSLGVLLYHLASGAFPVAGRTVRELRDAHARHRRTRLREANPRVPAHIADVVRRAIAPNPTHRFQSAADLRGALEAARDGRLRRTRLSRLAVAVCAAAMVALAVWTQEPGTSGRSPFAEPSQMSAESMWSSWETVILGRPAPEGLWMGCTPQRGADAGRLARCDLGTGTVELLGGTDLRSRQPPEFSPDREQMAYVTRAPIGEASINVAAVDGSAVRTVLAEQAGEALRIEGWSIDGRQILAHRVLGHRLAIIAIEVATGRIRDLVPAGSPAGSLSPDWRHMVFAAQDRRGMFGLWIRDLRSGDDTVLLERVWRYGPRPTWTPSGAVLYTSDRNGTLGLWRIEVRDGGAAAGPPQLVQDTGRREVWPHGFTADGSFIHGLAKTGFDSFVAVVDVASAAVVEPPRRLAADPLEANATPAWSSDGQWVGYVSARPADPLVDGADRAGLLTVRRIDGTDQRTFPVRPQHHQTRLRWWPDSHAVVIANPDRLERRDVRTGDVVGSLLEGRGVLHFEIDPASRRLFYLAAGRASPELRVLDLDGLTDRLVYTGPVSIASGFSLSVDGGTAALVARTRDGINILTVSTETGAQSSAIPVLSQVVPGPFTADGRFLLFSRPLDAGTSRSQVHRLDLATRDIRPLDIVEDHIWQMRLHPDGRRLAFVTGSPGPQLFALRGDLVR